jgi:uncharacterized membrane protein YqhA
MVRSFLAVRFLMLLASVGALLGAVVMFWLAGGKLIHGVALLWPDASGSAGEITAAVMGATDAFLFAVVLIIFAYTIAFGFVLHPTDDIRDTIPKWMRLQGVSELKHTLVEVIIVYLVVDFATDTVAAGEGATPAWTSLVKPAAVMLIAMALHFMSTPAANKD